MGTFLGQGALTLSDDGDEAPAQLLSDSQISELDLDLPSATETEESIDAHGFVRSPLAPVRTNQRQSHRPSKPQSQRIPSEYNRTFPSQPRQPFHLSSPYGNQPIDNRHRTSREPSSSNRLHGRSLAPDTSIYTSVSLPPDRFEDDAVPIDPKRVPLHPDESQQDLAERINALTQAIQSNTKFCCALSAQMVTMANQNKHLLPAFSSKVSSAVTDYVIEPALKLPGTLKTLYPALQDYEDKVRRRLANSANGRDMVLAQGVGKESDVKRLKDRLVEQDAVLSDHNSYIQRLIKERDALRQQLKNIPMSPNASETESGTASSEQGRYKNHGRSEQTTDRGVLRDSVVLADQLREIRILVDQLALNSASNHDRNSDGSHREDEDFAADSQCDEEDDWTLL
ncbi:hypothetical protein PG995_009425 [Apiospora arundinis]